jgi:hypothetical protein
MLIACCACTVSSLRDPQPQDGCSAEGEFSTFCQITARAGIEALASARMLLADEKNFDLSEQVAKSTSCGNRLPQR